MKQTKQYKRRTFWVWNTKGKDRWTFNCGVNCMNAVLNVEHRDKESYTSAVSCCQRKVTFRAVKQIPQGKKMTDKGEQKYWKVRLMQLVFMKSCIYTHTLMHTYNSYDCVYIFSPRYIWDCEWQKTLAINPEWKMEYGYWPFCDNVHVSKKGGWSWLGEEKRMKTIAIHQSLFILVAKTNMLKIIVLI